MKDRERIVDELFAQVVELGPAERQALFAEKAAADGFLVSEGVIAEVESLLCGFQSAEEDDFLRRPLVSGEAFGWCGQTLAEGQEFEGYRILRLVAEGGMGEVYLAEDAELDRKVAIKLIKGGLKTGEVLRRFYSERQILASLQHPNIARLFEAGATADGLPFFVMEYVEGQPIDRYADEQGLSIAQRLRLFRAVCSAVSHAHRSLVIHRDIKPGNILVTAEGEPKLLDFGIAKLLHGADAEDQNATATLFRAMTPEYASPEQVKGGSVTTATDVYSLGVLLYELLTGERPYKLKGRGANEITKAICEQEPTKPSHRISEAGLRGAEPKADPKPAPRNPKLLRGDLDNIVLKALRKEPQRRYASVEQLAEDIERHLEGLPVRARKGTFGYRASKFVQRNKVGVSAAALVLLTLVGGIIATAWEAHKANLERARAENRFNEVRELAHSVLFNYHDAIAMLPGSTAVREQLVKDALKYLDNLSKDESNSPPLQRELANAYLKVGDIQGKPYNPNLGDTEGALASYLKAQTILESLPAAGADNLDVKYDLALACQDIGRIKRRMGHRDEALKAGGRAVALSESLVAAHAENVEYQRLLSSSHLFFGQELYDSESIGDFRAALDHFRKALMISEALSASNPADIEDRYFAAICYGHVGYALWNIGDLTGDADSYREALDSHRKYRETMEAVSAAEPTNAEYKRVLVYATADFGGSQLKTGDASGALLSYQRALAMFEKLMVDDPANIEARRFLGRLDGNMSEALAKTGNLAEALAYSRKALGIYEALSESDPSSEENHFLLIRTHENVGDLLVKRGDTNGALASYRKAAAISETWSLAEPANIKARGLSANEYFKIGGLYATMAADLRAVTSKQKENWRAARDWYQKSLGIYQDMKSKGTLGDADAGKPDEVVREIANCDTALRD